MGSLIAFYLDGKERDPFPSALQQILSLVGFGLIAGAALTLSKQTPFPGFSAYVQSRLCDLEIY